MPFVFVDDTIRHFHHQLKPETFQLVAKEMFVLVIDTGRTRRTVLRGYHQLIKIIHNGLKAIRIDVEKDTSVAVS
jgi:hypothetical protein